MRRIILSLIVLSYAVVATAAPAVMRVAPDDATAAGHAGHVTASHEAPHATSTIPPCSDEHAPAAADMPCAPAQQDCCDGGGGPIYCTSCACPALTAVTAPAPGFAPLLLISLLQAGSAAASPPSRIPPLLFRPPIA